jgi:hypothetical protein
MEEQWINGMYMYMCMYVCMYVLEERNWCLLDSNLQ